jgi:hypothetical protein
LCRNFRRLFRLDGRNGCAAKHDRCRRAELGRDGLDPPAGKLCERAATAAAATCQRGEKFAIAGADGGEFATARAVVGHPNFLADDGVHGAPLADRTDLNGDERGRQKSRFFSLAFLAGEEQITDAN